MVLQCVKPRIICTIFLICILCLTAGCGVSWEGRILHLENGKVVIQSEGNGEIKSGKKVLIYRQKSITHPVTDELLGTVTDKIAEIPVLWINGQTITAFAVEPEFSMIMPEDRATAVRGSVKALEGFVREVGTIGSVDFSIKTVSINPKAGEAIRTGEMLTVVKYTDAITDPDTGKIVAVGIEPVATLSVIRQSQASYKLADEVLGWVEVGDIVVRRTGDMLAESLWFQDPPYGFSSEQIFSRNYLRAIRLYESIQYREALLELNQVIQSDPGYADARYLMGLCQMNLNRYDEAESSFNEILKSGQGNARVVTALAYTYLKQEKLKQASEAYEKLTEILPDNPKVWVDLGDIYRRLGENQKALQAYLKAQEIDLSDPEASYELRIEEQQKTSIE